MEVRAQALWRSGSDSAPAQTSLCLSLHGHLSLQSGTPEAQHVLNVRPVT